VLFFLRDLVLLLRSPRPVQTFRHRHARVQFVFTLFELLVAVLQAYVFTILTAVYLPKRVGRRALTGPARSEPTDLNQHDLNQHDLNQHDLNQHDLNQHSLNQHDLNQLI
jgi:hypothetical protein